MKRSFTVIEFIIVVAIIGIIAAIVLPLFLEARNKSRYVKWMSDNKQECTFEEFQSAFIGIGDNGEILVDKSLSATNKDIFKYWCLVTGNPKNLTSKEFEVFRRYDLIYEFSFDYYVSETGNKRNLTREEFTSLRDNDLIDFQEVWRSRIPKMNLEKE